MDTVEAKVTSRRLAVVVGVSGGLGGALLRRLDADGRYRTVPLARMGEPPLDLTSETSIAAAARYLVSLGAAPGLVLDATGFLHGDGIVPEKSWRTIDPDAMARAFTINAIGPALLMKHLLPLFPREGRCVFATLSAKVGSISDNRYGGWYSYRASKAALNQLVRTAAIELARRRPEAICVAIHPGTVDTPLTLPFAKTGLDVQTPERAADRLLATVDRLRPEQSGAFLDADGHPLPW